MSTGETPAETQGRLVCGRYRLRSELGQGGMGVVWLGHDELLDRTVAVKQVVAPHAPQSERDSIRERMLREARAAARLDHPGSVRVYDVVEEGEDCPDAGQPWIVMEVLTGNTLQDAIREDGPLPVRRVAEIGLALIDAVLAAHRAGILHRDIKPSNVQLCDDGRVVLTDFGIASITGDSSITRTGDIVGSPAYMSPERAHGAALGPESDFFALGSTLYAAVEGRSPFERDTPIATLTAVVNDPPAPFQRAGALTPVLEGLLAKDPAARMDAETARSYLAAAASGSATDANTATGQLGAVPREHTTATQAMPAVPPPTSTPTPEQVQRSAPRRGRGLRWAAFGFVLVAAAGATLLFLLRDDDGDGEGPFEPGAGSIPATWETYRDPSGWSVSTPPGWTRESEGDLDRFRRPPEDPYGYLAVVVRDSNGTPTEVLESIEAPFEASHDVYEQESLTTTTFRGAEAALLTFTYTDQGAELKASQLAVPAADGRTTYVLWWQTRPEDWDSTQRLRSRLLASFRPAA